MSEPSSHDLPRPFYDDWPGALRPHVQALWDWHSGLLHAQPITSNGQTSVGADFFAEEQERVQAGEALRMLREDVWKPAYRVCYEHDLSRGYLADQIEGVQKLQGRVRFADTPELNTFVRQWIVSHGRLLGGLAGVDQKWNLNKLDELARGFFFVGRLLQLPHDLKRDRLFIPVDNLEQSGVSIEQLRAGTVDDNMRRLLWKQSIRARDAMGQGQSLIPDVPGRRLRFVLKRWWLGALEMLSEVERREYDLWSAPIELSLFRKTQVYLQAFFGKATMRG